MISNLTEENVMGIQVVVAVVIGLVILVLLWRPLRASSKRLGVLLLGLYESDKTQLFSQLYHDTTSYLAKELVTNQNIFLQHRVQRMNVRMAVQLFSETTAKSL
ncbi:hypothetical protein Pcinc_031309 [Petrolisthes cinctipes]|uniref:Uncharacterized protein n=1 Tax=Petrolisthes cinctipes TaxID=88211 RepID=A0AAE1K520_PETCI|nr:hypothetical protein Pcinc_031309 [Petrolisthes cinctipes]